MSAARATISVAVLTLAACSSGRAAIGPNANASPLADSGPPSSPTRDVDMLFMIDNSGSMRFPQHKLAAAFASLVDGLKALPGGMPNLHLAVVSSDMGAGPQTDLLNCVPGGDRGVFQSSPRGDACPAASLAPGQTFIADVGDERNYTGSLSDALSCIAALDEFGCAFEHPLASVLRALGADGAPAPAENADFLRPDAALFVVLFTNEDDCSAPPDTKLFDTSSRFISDPLGPVSSFRCNERGHLCGGARPPRTPAAGSTDLSGTCHSAEDGTLIKIADAVRGLRQLKADPAKVFVAAIAGPPDPYVVQTGAATLKDDPVQGWPEIRHSCWATDGTYADPAVRIADWVDAFGNNGLFETFCPSSYEPALGELARLVGKAVAGAPAR